MNTKEIRAKNRNVYIDIMKGIGIISVVIGHTVDTIDIFGYTFHILQLVYTYHMALFFFCSGYLFKEKYLENPFNYIGQKVKGLYIPFIKYVTIYALLANVFAAMGILDLVSAGLATEKYMDFGAVITMIGNGLTFESPGMFLTAFWFIPVLFFSMCLFCYVLSKFKHYIFVGGIFSVFCGILGMYLIVKGYGFKLSFHITFLIMPVIYVGFCVKRHWNFLQKYVSIIASIVIAVLLYTMILRTGNSIDLARGWIISPVLFYVVTFLGIYMVLGFSKLISKGNILTKLFSYIGKNSLSIMTMHVFAVKLVDLFAVKFFGFPAAELDKFVYSFDCLWPAYYIVGVAFPLIIHELWCKLVNAVKIHKKI